MTTGQPNHYAYEGSHHCTDCARERFGGALDGGTAIDLEGNRPGAGFDTDELDAPASCNDCSEFIMTGLTDTGELYVIDAIMAKKGRPEVLEEWREAFDWLEEKIRGAICDTEFEAVADGGAGQYGNADYFDRIADFVAGRTGTTLPTPEGLDDPEWGHEAVLEAMDAANTILQEANADRILAWHDHLPGVLMAGSERAWHAATEPLMPPARSAAPADEADMPEGP